MTFRPDDRERLYEVEQLLLIVNHKLDHLLEGNTTMQAAWDELRNEVAALTDAKQAVLTYIEGLVAKLEGAASLADVKSITAEIKSTRESMASAVVQDTPADPSA